MGSVVGADRRQANEETRQAWNQNAAFWDERMGEGNDFVEVLIWPPTERLLNLLGEFHYRSVTWPRAARNLLKIFLHRNQQANVERLLLGLALDRDIEVTGVDLVSLAQRARIPGYFSWQGMCDAAIDRWYRLRDQASDR